MSLPTADTAEPRVRNDSVVLVEAVEGRMGSRSRPRSVDVFDTFVFFVVAAREPPPPFPPHASGSSRPGTAMHPASS